MGPLPLHELAGGLQSSGQPASVWNALQIRERSAPPFEELDGALVPLRGFTRLERPQIAATARFWINLAAVKPVLSRGEFPDHDVPRRRQLQKVCRRPLT